MQSFSHLFLQRLERFVIGSYPESVRANVRIELFASFWYGLFFAASLTFFPVILRRLGATPFDLALYVIFSYIGQTLSPLSLALLQRASPLCFSIIAWSFGRGLLLCGALLTGAPWLLALAALFWIAEALPAPAYARIMQQIYPPRYRGRAMSAVRIGVAIVVLVATPVAGWALDQVGHQPLFALAAIFGVVSSLIFSRVRPLDGVAEPESPPTLRELLPIVRRDRRFMLYLIVLVVYGFGAVMALPLYPLVQVSRLQLSYTTIGYLNLVQSIFWLAGFFVWGRLLDRYGPLWVLRLSMLLAAFVPFTYVWAGNAWMLLPAFICQGLMQGGFELGITTGVIDLAERGRVMEYTALQAAIIGVRGMLAPLLGSLLLGIGASEALVLGAATGLVIASCVLLGAVQPPRTS
ncbi:MFS transporter [Roseiflexus castenholzii]|uniref:Major facilitator superfamily MFS_1 n=1 Tax=Roseiflexus castenholzii (strain DSM 13941 / HLO8) TaxID=383372 RepID=A7NI30_ROSCS|nr:MFS transporter [Roseiflexus castenholzii]ABU57130.1 major facilitator superfamily MFS_1 [Roseiflexus castenholzii DSM 13941]